MKKHKLKLNPEFVKAHKKPSGGAAATEISVASGVPSALLKQARRSGHLNLSNRGLTSVPESVWKINIDPVATSQAVDISNSKEHWWDQVDLTKLILASNQLKELPEDIQHLPTLHLLDVHGNELLGLPHNIGQLASLTRLVLSHNKLQSLVPELFHLTCLQSLKLDFNELTTIPDDVQHLVSLEELDLSHNKLESIPDELCELHKLLHLDLSHNNLKCLPQSLGTLQGLQDLAVSHNALQEMPPLEGAYNLVVLDVRQNKLSHIPKLKPGKCLKELLLGENCICELDCEMMACYTSLILLDLRSNALREVPEDISSLTSVERLDLSNNHLTGLPPKMGLMPNLKNLTLEGNPLKTLRIAIIKKGTFEILKYLRSRIVVEPEEISQSGPTPSHASSTKQQTDSVPDVAECRNTEVGPESKTVKLSKCNLTEVPQSVFEAVQASKVVLSFNKVSVLPSDIGRLTKLTILDLRNNHLSSLPDELCTCSQIREMVIEFNRFACLPSVIYKLKKLETLFAGSNQIANIDVKGLRELPCLTCLDLGNNDIQQVPPELGLLSALRYLELGGNPFRNPRAAILAKGTAALLAYLKDRIPQ